ncbi:MAG: T9SS type A sorting domain-containing protein [Bacteroidales bacterium]
MKRTLVFIIFILIGFSTQAQAPYTFNKTQYFWGDSTHMLNTIMSFTKVDSVLYMAVGMKDANKQVQRLTVVNTDLQGNVINKKKISSDQYDSYMHAANSILFDKDSNIVIGAVLMSDSIDGYVVKMDRNLDIKWLKRYDIYDLPGASSSISPGQNINNEFMSVDQTYDGGYILSGRTEKDTLSSFEPGYIIKLDTAGNVQWSKLYDQASAIHEVVQTPDSGFVFADCKSGLTINKTDQYGNIVWQRKKLAGQGNMAPGEVALMNNQYVVSISPYAYKQLSPHTYRFALQVVKYDLQGNLQFDKRFRIHKSFESRTINQGFGLETNAKGEIFIGGTSFVIHEFAPDTGGYKGVLLKLNSQGDSLWSRYYSTNGLADLNQFNDLILMDDGGFMACGYHQPYPFTYNWGAWLVRMDSMGMAPGAYTVDVEYPKKKPENAQIHLYPNPARTQVTIDLSGLPQPETYQLGLYNMSGEKVKNMRIRKSRKQINLEGLEPGLYLYRATTKSNTKTYQGKFIKVE